MLGNCALNQMDHSESINYKKLHTTIAAQAAGLNGGKIFRPENQYLNAI